MADIDEIRSNVNDLIVETIKLIDDVYRKGRYTQDRGKRVDDRLKVFKEHTFAENRLPTFAVDPYCLYSEGNAKSPVAEYFCPSIQFRNPCIWALTLMDVKFMV